MNGYKFNALTWLRGAAAFFVIVNHVILSAREQYSNIDSAPFIQPLDILNLGMFAVYLFFALSGATLTLNYATKIKSVKDFFPFYVKRFFRIWPSFAVSMLVFIIFIEFFKASYPLHKGAWIELFLKNYSLVNVFQYLSLSFNITGPRDLFNGPYWSLPVEFQYYLLLPFVLICMRNKLTSVLMPLIAGAACYVIYSLKLIPMDRPELFKMGFSFFGGVLVAVIYPFFKIKIPIAVSITIFLVVIAICGVVANRIVHMPESLPIINDPNNFFGVCAVLVVGLALLTDVPKTKSRLDSFFMYYGEVSYSTYLFHMLFVGVSVVLLIDLNIHGYLEKLLLIFIITTVGSYYFSKITFVFLEKPSIALGASFFRKKPSQHMSEIRTQ